MKGIKIKIFKEYKTGRMPKSEEGVEERVNGWLEDNPSVDVVDMKISTAPDDALAVMVLYHPEPGPSVLEPIVIPEL
jgi:hypothetical protein